MASFNVYAERRRWTHVEPRKADAIICVPELFGIKSIANGDAHRAGILIVGEEGGVEPVRVREVQLSLVPAGGSHDVAPGFPKVVDVHVVWVEDGIPTGRVVDAYVFDVGVRWVANPGMHCVVRAEFHRARAWHHQITETVGLPVEERGQRRVGDHLKTFFKDPPVTAYS